MLVTFYITLGSLILKEWTLRVRLEPTVQNLVGQRLKTVRHYPTANRRLGVSQAKD